MSTLTQTGEVTVTIEVGGEEISFSSGRLAKQADGAVVVRSGETMVLATAVGRTEAREGADFFPPGRSPVASSSARGRPPRRPP
jgi:polyribonucleotide nucleotidyltransferase